MVRGGTFILISTIIVSSHAFAGIIHIPMDFSTIQAGIGNSQPNDTILVSPGTYPERLTIANHPVTLASEYLMIEDTSLISTTIIDASSVGTAIAITQSGQSASSIIGLTITGGSGEFGGGISVNASRCRIVSNYINGNQASVYGPAIYSINSPDITISNNIIYGNSGNVGAIFIHNSTFVFDHNLVYANLSAIALELFQVNDGVIINNTFTDNQCGDYGQITVNAESELSIVNNIVTSSTRYGIYFFDTFTIPCIYNDVWNNVSGNYFRATAGEGSISDDPLLTDNFSLEITSPCIDAGDPSAPTDLDGTIPDMGARYYDQGHRIYPFHLLEPEDREVVNSPFQPLIWNAAFAIDSPRVISYRVFWDTDQYFQSPEISDSLFDTLFINLTGFTRSVRYYWRVLASDNYPDSLFSIESRSFYVDGIPSIPEIIAPDNGVYADTGTILAWFLSTDPDSLDISTYTLQIDNDTDFSSPAITQYGLEPETGTDDAMGIRLSQLDDIDYLPADEIYYWRLRADDSYGVSSEWTSGVNWFYYRWGNHPPEPFPIISPEDSERLINFTNRFTWNRAEDIDPNSSVRYEIQCSADSAFQGIVFADSGLSDTSIVLNTDTLLSLGSAIYWRVLAIDNTGQIRIGGIPEGALAITIGIPGDANNSGRLNGLDLIYIKNLIYNSGPAPVPLLSGDQNGDCQINSLDITALCTYFKGFGPQPPRPDCQ